MGENKSQLMITLNLDPIKGIIVRVDDAQGIKQVTRGGRVGAAAASEVHTNQLSAVEASAPVSFETGP